jgi:hypothetical protein
VEDVAGVQVDEAVEELVEEGFEDGGGYGCAQGLRVVMNYLLMVFFSVDRYDGRLEIGNAPGNRALRIQRPYRWTCLPG